MITRIVNLWTKIRASLWFIPTLMAISAVAMACLTLIWDQSSEMGQFFKEMAVLTIDPQGARTLLATVAGSVIGIAGVSFSITIVALTLASSQFGPRLLNNFMKDLANQLVLGTFIATFIYCLLVLASIQESASHIFVPQISINVGILLTFVSLGAFIYFIHHISVSINAEYVITDVSKDLEKAINHLFPEKIGQGQADNDSSSEKNLPQNIEHEARPLLSPSTGYLQAIDQQGIMSLATDHDVLIHLKHRPGAFIVTGEVLARLWSPHIIEDPLLKNLSSSFLIGNKRTEEQDVEFAIHQLVEVALRALSPGINDPFTAIGCIDRLGGCLNLLAKRTFPSAYRYDRDQKLRVVAHPITMEGIFNAAFNQIRQDGASCVAVGLRLLEILGVLASLADRPTVRKPIHHHARMVKEEMVRHIKEPADQEEVEKRYGEIQKLLDQK